MKQTANIAAATQIMKASSLMSIFWGCCSMSISTLAIDSCQLPCILSLAKRKKVTKMADKALISELTWRSLKMQKDAFPDMPHFTLDELSSLLRPTSRKEVLNIHVISLAIVAERENKFREFIEDILSRRAYLCVKDENMIYAPPYPIKMLVDRWRAARREGAAKKGGEVKAEKSEKEFWEKFSIIKNRWHGDERSKDLLKEAKIKHHDTVRVNLGYTRWEWRRLSDAKRERVLKQKEKELRNAKR